MKDWEAQLNSTGESGQLPISKAQEAPESCECGQALMHRVQYLRCRKSGLLQGEARSPVHLSLTQRLGMNAATNFQPIGNNPDSYSEFAAVGNVALTHDLGSISQLPAMGPEINLQRPVTTLDSGPSLTAIGDSSAQGSHPDSRQSGSKGPGLDLIHTSTNDTNLAEEFLNTKLFKKFDKIQKHLHWAGFPSNYGTFSSLRTNKGRQFKRVNDHGLHLPGRTKLSISSHCLHVSAESCLILES